MFAILKSGIFNSTFNFVFVIIQFLFNYYQTFNLVFAIKICYYQTFDFVFAITKLFDNFPLKLFLFFYFVFAIKKCNYQTFFILCLKLEHLLGFCNCNAKIVIYDVILILYVVKLWFKLKLVIYDFILLDGFKILFSFTIIILKLEWTWGCV